MFTFQKITNAIEDIKNGKMLILVDDENVENVGSLIMSADNIKKESVNFMIKFGSGLINIALTEERINKLDLPHIAGKALDSHNDSLVSVDYEETINGISAEDRALTIKKLVDDKVTRTCFKVPGHVFIVKSSRGGVLKKVRNIEASVDLSTIADLYPAGVVCDLLNEDGDLAKLPELIKFGEKYNINLITIADLIAYRRERDCYVTLEAEANLPTAYGKFKMKGFVNSLNGEHHVALVKGDISVDDEVLVRVHSECLTGDAFHSLKCDCGEQLTAAMVAIEKEGKGILLYLRQEGRGIGLINKIKAYKLQEEGLDTEEANLALGFPSDMRDYGIGAQILSLLNVRKMRLMTNNPKKLIGLKGHGIEVVSRVPLIMETNEFDERYFKTKKEKMGHLL